MAHQDKKTGGGGLSRRDFLKTTAAATAVGAAGLDFAARPSRADAATVAATYHTTCPYCSASCGQLVDVDADGNVLDVYGDYNSPLNGGGLCAKGAGSHQLATNPRRLGVPENSAFSGRAWRRVGDKAWQEIDLDTAFTAIAQGATFNDPDGVSFTHKGLVKDSPAAVGAGGLRGTVTPGTTAASNAKTVQFFGSSHMNNEGNYLFRKIVANFGTSCVEHQARI